MGTDIRQEAGIAEIRQMLTSADGAEKARTALRHADKRLLHPAMIWGEGLQNPNVPLLFDEEAGRIRVDNRKEPAEATDDIPPHVPHAKNLPGIYDDTKLHSDFRGYVWATPKGTPRGVMTEPLETLKRNLGRQQSPSERAQLTRHAPTAARVLLDQCGLGGDWTNFKKKLPNPEKPIGILDSQMFPEPPSPFSSDKPKTPEVTWLLKGPSADADEPPVVQRFERFLSTTESTIPVYAPDGSLRWVTRRTRLGRATLFVVHPDLRDIMEIDDSEPPSEGFVPLAQKAVDELRPLIEEGASGGNVRDYIVPAISSLLMRTTVEHAEDPRRRR